MYSSEAEGVRHTAYDRLLPYPIAVNDFFHPRTNNGGRGPGPAPHQMPAPHSNEGYYYGNMTMAPPMIQDTEESIQRDFDLYMRETGATSTAPFHSATHHAPRPIYPYVQLPPFMGKSPVEPSGDYHGAQAANPPVNGRGRESSTSTRHRSPVSKPYARSGPAALPKKSRTAYQDELAKDARLHPSTSQPTEITEPGLLNYVHVPQETFYCGPTTYRPIEFAIPKDMQWRLSAPGEAMQRLSPPHKNPQDKLSSFAKGLEEIKIIILWPGYPQGDYPFETRIMTKNGNITRGELFDLVCGAMCEFVGMLKKRKKYVVKEHAKWMIGHRGLRVDTFCFTRLLHRGGNYFQPEIWVPLVESKNTK